MSTPPDLWASYALNEMSQWVRAHPDEAAAELLGRAARAGTGSMVGERRAWSGGVVEAVAEIPGWVFVQPSGPSPAGRPFSIARATWVGLPLQPAGPGLGEQAGRSA